jgi:deazaflavin-dependent oxidoreductase (nitroreductase family)
MTTPAHNATSRMHRFSVRAGASARPISGRRLLPIYGLLHHVGRKSGTEYTAPVVIRHAADGIYVPLPFGEATNWYRNAVAAGGVRATWKGRDLWLANPTLVGAETAAAAFSRWQRATMRMAGMANAVRFDAESERS